MRLRVGVVFIPFHPAGVLNQLLQRHAVPGGAFQFGFINGNQVIKGVDFTLLNGDTDQRRDHRFAYRARGPQGGVGITFGEIFPGDFTIFQHQHTADVLALQVILQIPGVAVERIAGIGQLFFSALQRRRGAVAEDIAGIVAIVIAKANHA